MNISLPSLLISLSLPLPCLAEQSPAPPTPPTQSSPLTPATPLVPSTESPPPAESQEAERELPAPEKHIRKGIITLNNLYKVLEGVHNKQTADTAAIEILKIQNELVTWGQGFSALVPLTGIEQQQYEQVYLPIIKQINTQLRSQAARLHSAKYYDSKDLPQVLIQFVNRVK